MIVRLAVAVIAGTVLLAGCGGSAEDSTRAALLATFSDPGSFGPLLSDVVCDAEDSTTSRGVEYRSFRCAGDEETTKQWLWCFGAVTEPHRFGCANLDSASDSPVYTLPQLLAAPKGVTWKCFDVDEQGQNVGEVLVYPLKTGEPVQQYEGSYTEAQARQIARGQYRTVPDIDCP